MGEDFAITLLMPFVALSGANYIPSERSEPACVSFHENLRERGSPTEEVLKNIEEDLIQIST